MSRPQNTRVAVLFALALAAPRLHAQNCNGTAAFSAGRLRAGLGIGFPAYARSGQAELAYGPRNGFYVTGRTALSEMKATGDRSVKIEVTAGKTLLIGSGKKFEMCPQLSISTASGPPVGVTDVRTNSLGLGLSIGTVLRPSTRFELVPFGAPYLRRSAMTLTSPTATTKHNDIAAGLAFGAGFVFGKRWSLTPRVDIHGQGRLKPVFGLTGSLNFGKP